MHHNFKVEIAVKYGILEAILFENKIGRASCRERVCMFV